MSGMPQCVTVSAPPASKAPIDPTMEDPPPPGKVPPPTPGTPLLTAAPLEPETIGTPLLFVATPVPATCWPFRPGTWLGGTWDPQAATSVTQDATTPTNINRG